MRQNLNVKPCSRPPHPVTPGANGHTARGSAITRSKGPVRMSFLEPVAEPTLSCGKNLTGIHGPASRVRHLNAHHLRTDTGTATPATASASTAAAVITP